jgi:hypothetical protein
MVSRTAREGRFVGRWQGKAVRTRHRMFIGMGVDADTAWAVMSKRARRALLVRRPRYIPRSGVSVDEFIEGLEPQEQREIAQMRHAFRQMTHDDLLALVRRVFVSATTAPFACRYCGQPSWVDPVDQSAPVDVCHAADHGIGCGDIG